MQISRLFTYIYIYIKKNRVKNNQVSHWHVWQEGTWLSHLESGGTPNHPTLGHVSIETNIFGGITNFKKPPYTIQAYDHQETPGLWRMVWRIPTC